MRCPPLSALLLSLPQQLSLGSLFMTGLFLSACGAIGGQGSSACLRAERLLKERVGPEFSKVTSQLPLEHDGSPMVGCALLYTLVDEELPGEVSGARFGDLKAHQLAIALPHQDGRLILTLPFGPQGSPGTVQMKLALQEVYQGEPQELIVSSFGSRQVRYQGLQIFTYKPGVPTPREIFNESLILKSEGGAELIARWSAESEGETPLIVLQGTGILKVFAWDEGTRRFKHSLPFTQRRLLKGRSAQAGESAQ